ncbi:MAG: hypothetical protein ABFS09_02890 [Thermodesulfobacteriota bacterium]
MCNLKKIQVLISHLLFSFSLILVSCVGAFANGQLVDNVEVIERAGRQDIKIDFTAPIRYLSHTPASEGKILQVFFQKIIPGDIDDREEVRWSQSPDLPLEDIHLEVDSAGNPNLLFTFQRQVQFKITTGDDLQSLTIAIKKRGVSPTPIQPPQIAKKVAKPSKSIQKYAYTITLKSSTKPFTKTDIPPLSGFDNYKVYTSRFQKNDLTIHRLRLGYFDTESQARKGLAKLKKQFPTAWIAKVAKGQTIERPSYAINLDSAAQYDLASLKRQTDQLNKELKMGPGWTLTPPADYQTQKPEKIKAQAEQHLYQLYITKFKTDDGRISNRLRLGFFSRKEQAEEMLTILKEFYPQAWITLVSAQEKIQSEDQSIATARYQATSTLAVIERAKKVMPKTKVPSKKLKAIPMEQIDKLFAEAEKEMTSGNFRRAIQIYTKILTDKEHKKRKLALELLAHARERNGQLAHARAEYKKYIELYPEGEDTERVRQRLAGLMTARVSPQKKLKKTKKEYPLQVYGSVSQFYYYDETTDETGNTVVNRSSLSSNMDFSIRKRTATYDIRTLAVGGYEADFEDSSNNETRITNLYVDAVDKKRNLSGRFGRQSKSTGGVLGRFDGGQASYNLTPKIKVTGVGGYSVSSTDIDDFSTDKYFYGMSLDFGTFGSYWDFSPYVIEQKINGLTDRQAIGGEIRFFHPNATFFTLTDYDIYYDKLNTFLFNGNITFPNKTMINMMADYRNSPILSINNALQGHVGYTSISDLAPLYSEDELKEIAINRTARSKTFMLGIVQPLTSKLQISADATASKLSSLDAFETSRGIRLEAVPGTDYDYYYSLQLIGSSLLKEGDIAIVGFNYTDASTHETYSASLNTRYPFNRSWRINPRVRVDWRENKTDGVEQFKIRPLLKIDYSLRKPRARFELEIGGEWVDNKLPTETEKTSGYFATVGYRFDF